MFVKGGSELDVERTTPLAILELIVVAVPPLVVATPDELIIFPVEEVLLFEFVVVVELFDEFTIVVPARFLVAPPDIDDVIGEACKLEAVDVFVEFFDDDDVFAPIP